MQTIRVRRVEYEYEGPASEFKLVEPWFSPSMPPKLHPTNAESVEEGSSPTEESVAHTEGGDEQSEEQAASSNTAASVLTEAAVEECFKRHPLPSQQQAAVIKLVYDAGDAGMTIDKISEAMKIETASVKALIRLLGKRRWHTRNWPKDVGFFRQKWDGLRNTYWLHDAVRAAIDAGRVKL